MKNQENSRILCISDLHAPYHHPDTYDFLKLVKDTYKPTRIVLLGDELDKHSLSFHDSDPNLPSASDELQQALDLLMYRLYDLFPKADIIESNHGSMHFRKAKHHGIPMKYVKDYGEVLEAPDTWNWHPDLLLTLPNGQQVYFHHGMAKNGLKLAQQMGCCTVQGHYHTEFNIQYTSSPAQLYWSMQVGCSIDDKSLAFEYNKTTLGRPIIGHGIIIDGHPMLLPMVLDKNGKWIGELK